MTCGVRLERTNCSISGVTYMGGVMRNSGRPAIGLRETACHADSPVSCKITASARSKNSRAEFLKSAVAGSSTDRYKSGRKNFNTLLDSIITLRASSRRWRNAGIASASRPCSVLTHRARSAPATRKREVSDSPDGSRSSEIAHEWSSVEQSQGSPLAEQTPCPYCVIFTAVQSNSRRAEMSPATTLVLPTLRECPPMTTSATATPFSPGAPASLTASDTAAAAAPECPRRPHLCRAESCSGERLPARRA